MTETALDLHHVRAVHAAGRAWDAELRDRRFGDDVGIAYVGIPMNAQHAGLAAFMTENLPPLREICRDDGSAYRRLPVDLLISGPLRELLFPQIAAAEAYCNVMNEAGFELRVGSARTNHPYQTAGATALITPATQVAWRLIDTAPSGRAVLLRLAAPLVTNDLVGFFPESEMRVVIGWRQHDGWACGYGRESHSPSDGSSMFLEADIQPTGWAPLPAHDIAWQPQ